MNENYEMKLIKIGDNDPNELLDGKGTPSTQECMDYEFVMGDNTLIRLIDTPGIGDTRGPDKDKEKSAKDNIVFCFTNSRTTFYRPGETLVPLRKRLDELRKKSGIEIKTNRDTLYCFDNEAFRFLAAIRGGIKFKDRDERSFAESWEKSTEDSFKKIKKSADCFHYDNEIIKGLEETKSEYLMKIKNIKKAFNDIDSNSSEQLISPEDIEKFAQQLYTLELNGEP
ncbi:2775_t:CDS:2 [Paraglomus brasilianum]|uniref:2775_t:CDS:1 n=1 Tax=Paraglomus brasilianum TaxID=144538 RepID=A0A9N9GSV2_9GLOM|nr:2775_t:CDS:2 [Paraglomus brasilianum]